MTEDIRNQAYEDYYKFYTETYDKKEVHECPLEDKNIVFVTMRSTSAKEEIIKLQELSC